MPAGFTSLAWGMRIPNIAPARFRIPSHGGRPVHVNVRCHDTAAAILASLVAGGETGLWPGWRGRGWAAPQAYTLTLVLQGQKIDPSLTFEQALLFFNQDLPRCTSTTLERLPTPHPIPGPTSMMYHLTLVPRPALIPLTTTPIPPPTLVAHSTPTPRPTSALRVTALPTARSNVVTTDRDMSKRVA